MPQKEKKPLSVAFQKEVKQTTPFDFFFSASGTQLSWGSRFTAGALHRKIPPRSHPYSQLADVDIIRYKTETEKQPAKSWTGWKGSLLCLLPRQKWLITSLLCYAWLIHKIKWKPVRMALQAKGRRGHFLPCSETSELMMEMVVPSQTVIVLQAEQCYQHWRQLKEKNQSPHLKTQFRMWTRNSIAISCFLSEHMILQRSQIEKQANQSKQMREVLKGINSTALTTALHYQILGLKMHQNYHKTAVLCKFQCFIQQFRTASGVCHLSWNIYWCWPLAYTAGVERWRIQVSSSEIRKKQICQGNKTLGSLWESNGKFMAFNNVQHLLCRNSLSSQFRLEIVSLPIFPLRLKYGLLSWRFACRQMKHLLFLTFWNLVFLS